MSESKRPIVRPATKADIDAFSSMPEKPTVRAICGELDGRIIALGGLAYGQGRWYAFCDLTEEARPYKMHIMRAAKRLLDQAARDGIRYIYTESDPDEPKSLAWLQRLGFELDPRSQYFYRWSKT